MARKMDRQTYGLWLEGGGERLGLVGWAGLCLCLLPETPRARDSVPCLLELPHKPPPCAASFSRSLCSWQQASRMCRIVLERGRSQQGEPKGPKDAGFEQGRKSVDFRAVPASPTHFQRLVYVGLACSYSRTSRASLLTTADSIGDWGVPVWSRTISSIKFILRGQYKRRDGR